MTRRLQGILSALKRAFAYPDDAIIDHVPVQRTKPKRNWRERALAKAAAKYGKPFRCAGKEFNREVMLTPGEFRSVKAEAKAPNKPWATDKPEATVTKIKERAR